MNQDIEVTAGGTLINWTALLEAFEDEDYLVLEDRAEYAGSIGKAV